MLKWKIIKKDTKRIKKYDENIHEVISVVENGENRIGDVISKGYSLNGKIIRYPKIILFR